MKIQITHEFLIPENARRGLGELLSQLISIIDSSEELQEGE